MNGGESVENQRKSAMVEPEFPSRSQSMRKSSPRCVQSISAVRIASARNLFRQIQSEYACVEWKHWWRDRSCAEHLFLETIPS